MSKVILVTGATGNQGGAVVDALLKAKEDFQIIALTRNATSPSAKRLAAKSSAVKVLQGDMNQPQLVFSEAKKLVGEPVWGVFMVQSVIAGGVTAEQEEAQGKKFIDTCISHSVKFLVYTSVDRGGEVRSLQDPTPVSVFASKHRIEQHLFKAAKSSSMSWFVLRPTGLIEPLLGNDMLGKIGRTSWKVYTKGGEKWQWVSCKDVGHFATLGFQEPEQWAGKCLGLAGWEGSFADGDTISKTTTGKRFSLTFEFLAKLVCGYVVKDLDISYRWCSEKGFDADIEALRRIHPGLLDLKACLRQNNVSN